MAGDIALIDYGAGNLHSVYNALKAAGGESIEVTNDPSFVANADHIILPGVGAFGACKEALSSIDGMIEAMNKRVCHDAIPFLGICVGMQLLADKGVEHGTYSGLGWINGTVSAFDTNTDVKIPHMGWNDVTISRAHAALETGEAYFLHGYKFEVENICDILAVTDHGGEVVAAIGRDNILGVQFHPEKSQRYGIAFLSRFLEWKP